MKLLLRLAVGIISLFLLNSPAWSWSNLNIEAGIRGGYSENLFSDATDTEDSYSTTRAITNFYPLSNFELNLSGEYTLYNETGSLDNLLYAVKASYIPTSEESRFSVFLSGSFDKVGYRNESSKDFDNQNLGFTGSVGYLISDRIQLRTGARILGTQYKNSTAVDVDHQKYEWFGGINYSFLGSNALDVEFGYGILDFMFISSAIRILPPEPIDSMFNGSLGSFYVSPRYSRPIGKRTGISLAYTYRNFNESDHDEIVVLGSTKFLSPWSTIFDGQSIRLNIKTYLVPHAVVSTGIGYWEKTYLRTLESGRFDYEYAPSETGRRRDYMTRLFFSIERPIKFGQTSVIEPTLTLDYSDNNSTDPNVLEYPTRAIDVDPNRYDFTGLTITIGLTYRR